jgi:hypothetical protein
MKQIFLKTSIIISSILFFVACSKKDSMTTPAQDEIAGQVAQKGKPPVQMTRVKTRTIGSGVQTYTYDAAGRSLGYTGSSSLTYEYPDASHVTEIPQSSPIIHHELNNKGLAVSSLVSYGQIFNTYNPKKQLVTQLIQDNSGQIVTITYTYVNGNVDKITSTNNAGSADTPQTFTYYDTPNVLDNDVFGESFRGVGSKDLVKTRTVDVFGTIYVEYYTYEFDPQGRVTKVKRDANGTPEADILYTYY